MNDIILVGSSRGSEGQRRDRIGFVFRAVPKLYSADGIAFCVEEILQNDITTDVDPAFAVMAAQPQHRISTNAQREWQNVSLDVFVDRRFDIDGATRAHIDGVGVSGIGRFRAEIYREVTAGGLIDIRAARVVYAGARRHGYRVVRFGHDWPWWQACQGIEVHDIAEAVDDRVNGLGIGGDRPGAELDGEAFTGYEAAVRRENNVAQQGIGQSNAADPRTAVGNDIMTGIRCGREDRSGPDADQNIVAQPSIEGLPAMNDIVVSATTDIKIGNDQTIGTKRRVRFRIGQDIKLPASQ
ncbi:hypothetical protein WG926_08360 [Tistrella sp. BH-R2-4]|uniref:Uncharacterized protein n=1 Tax=Tistrella arctica TaxID=3133430 RepID=A0ABU9YI43_9PROT